jgi:hypothetical protein
VSQEHEIFSRQKFLVSIVKTVCRKSTLH